jgi:hypothetical protein
MAANDLSGLWLGHFAYPGGQGPVTPFVARIEDDAGVLTGTTIEPNTIMPGGQELEALLRGSRRGQAVDFVKSYDGAAEAAHAVDYVGQVSADGAVITGVWSMEALDGTFEMRRELADEESAGEAVRADDLDALLER